MGREGKCEKFLQREMENPDTQECGSMNNLVSGCQVSHTAANSILVRALFSFDFFILLHFFLISPSCFPNHVSHRLLHTSSELQVPFSEVGKSSSFKVKQKVHLFPESKNTVRSLSLICYKPRLLRLSWGVSGRRDPQ